VRSRRARAVLIAVLAGGLLGTFGVPAGAGPAVPGCRSTRHVVCIGRNDGGHRVDVERGQTVKVGLGGSGLRWSGLHQIGPHLLRQRGVTVSRRGELTASYVATTVGRTGLRASGAPNCAPGQACPQFILLWQVRITIVRPG
jgi:hypothetical protein